MCGDGLESFEDSMNDISERIRREKEVEEKIKLVFLIINGRF
jgi:hypothetical protein